MSSYAHHHHHPTKKERKDRERKKDVIGQSKIKSSKMHKNRGTNTK